MLHWSFNFSYPIPLITSVLRIIRELSKQIATLPIWGQMPRYRFIHHTFRKPPPCSVQSCHGISLWAVPHNAEWGRGEVTCGDLTETNPEVAVIPQEAKQEWQAPLAFTKYLLPRLNGFSSAKVSLLPTGFMGYKPCILKMGVIWAGQW